MSELRWYQQGAVDATWKYLREQLEGNPCIELPTGAGKTHVISRLIADAVGMGGRVLLLAHRKELLEQCASKLTIKHGIYSAGLGRREPEQDVVLAGIQSVYKRASKLSLRNLVLIDECHLLSPNDDTMYGRLLGDLRKINPRIRIVGLTATPYRLENGLVCGPDRLLTEICYSVPVDVLIKQGFLCQLRSKSTDTQLSGEGVAKRGGEFMKGNLDRYCADDDRVQVAVDEIIQKTAERHSVLVFAAGRQHGQKVAAALESRLLDPSQVEYLDGETLSDERAGIINRFKTQQTKFLVNIDVLTTGFDATCVDCVCLLRPTMSPGLYYQMVGRGLRLDPSKEDCLVLDFGLNVRRHGPINAIQVPNEKAKGQGGGECPTKVCPECQETVSAFERTCSCCGYEFVSEPEVKHEVKSDETPVLAEPEWFEVNRVEYHVHVKRGAPEGAPRTMRVEYWESDSLLGRVVKEWVCLEHPPGFARDKAERWWSERTSEPFPQNTEEGVMLAQHGALRVPASIEVVKEGSFDRIVTYDIPGDGRDPLDSHSCPLGDFVEALQREVINELEEEAKWF